MAKYCDTTDIKNELNGLSITSSTTPSTDTVEEWIKQESDLLKRETNTSWGYEVVEDEYLDYDGSGILRTNYAPLISITSFTTERNGIEAATENWITLTEGRTSSANYIIYKTEGELHFHGSTQPYTGVQNCKLSYAYGYETVNPTVTLIVAKRVSLRIIETVVNGQSGEEGGNVTVGAISISDPSNFSADRVRQLKTDINELIGKLGSFKTYRYNR